MRYFGLVTKFSFMVKVRKKTLAATPTQKSSFSANHKFLPHRRRQIIFCEKKLGGGCKWYCDATIDLDICTQCYNSDISKNFKLYEIAIRL